jgi:hypothetical protein
VLSDVANQQQPIIRLQPRHEGVHLLRTDETRFIQHIQAAPSLNARRRLDQVRLQSGRRHTGFRVVRCPTRRREPLQGTPVALRRVAHCGQRGLPAPAIPSSAWTRSRLRKISTAAARVLTMLH